MPKAASAPGPVIDCHVHVNAFHLLRPDAEAALERNQPDWPRIRRQLETPEGFLRLMDAQGIERACPINYVAPEVMGYTPEVNAWAHAYTKGHRDRLVPFGGFHPDAVKDAKKEIGRIVSTYEFPGVKVHGPHMLLAPNAHLEGSKGLRLLYETCEREGVTVMFHTGTSFFPRARNKFGDPMAVDDVAVDFPKLKIILAHGGRPLWMETATFLVRRHPNVHLDVSGLPPKALLDYFPKLESISDKVLFGSDWPGPNVPSMGANAEAVRALPLSSDAKNKILHGNAARLLRRG